MVPDFVDCVCRQIGAPRGRQDALQTLPTLLCSKDETLFWRRAPSCQLGGNGRIWQVAIVVLLETTKSFQH